MFRRTLIAELVTFVLLLVAFAIVMGASALAGAAGDASAENVLWWSAMVVMVLAALDLIAVVLTLAVRSLGPWETAEPTDQVD